MENNSERSEPFYVEGGEIFESLSWGVRRPICTIKGSDDREVQENTEFLLTLLNDYANKPLTEEEIEEASNAKP